MNQYSRRLLPTCCVWEICGWGESRQARCRTLGPCDTADSTSHRSPPLQHGEIRDSNTGDPAHSYCRTLETRDCRTLGPCETPNPESARQHARTQAPRALYRRVRTSIFCRSRSITAWRFPSPAMATIPSRGLTLSSKSRSHHKLRLASFISSRER